MYMENFKSSLLLFALVLISVNQGFAIDHVKEIEVAQEWADSFERPYPILIFNRDELHYRFLSGDATASDKGAEKKRQSIIFDYVLEKVGLELDRVTLSNIETQLFVTPGSAVAMPFHEGADKQYKVCTVFVNSPNGNAQIEAERITGMNVKKVYDNNFYDQLRIKEKFEVFYYFSMYHEVSHCLDQTFMPEAYKSYSPSAYDVHASESFAETLAYLQLSKRFDWSIAKARILYRILYSRKMGTFFAENPQLSLGDELVIAGGVVYYLAPVLAKAYEWLSGRKIKPNEVTNDQLYEAAQSIVSQNIIHFRSFAAIKRSLSDRELIIDEYANSSIKDPEFFFGAYEELMLYYATTDNWLKSAFDETITPQNLSLSEAPSLPKDELCSALNGQKLGEFLEILTDYRALLNAGLASSESRYKRYLELNSLSKTLSGVCQAE